MSSRLTAMDIEAQEFPLKLRGYDKEEVRFYLRSIAEEIERLNLENSSLLEERGRLREDLENFRARERSLQETLITAQRMSEEFQQKSRTEADIVLREARMKAERILEQAQDQLAKIEDEISRAKLERNAFESRVRNAVEEHQALLELRKLERVEPEDHRFLDQRSKIETG